MYHVLFIDSYELERYEEAMHVETKKKWEKGMKEDMESLLDNQNWELF